MEKERILKKPNTAFDELLKIVNRSDKSERDARCALQKKEFTETEVDEAIDKAKKYGYLSDERFAERYVYFKKSSKGKFRLGQELKQKGVADETIKAALEEYNDSAESCESVALRYAKNKVWEPKTAERLLRHLLTRGFSYSEARGALQKVKDEKNDEDTFDVDLE